MLDHWQKHSEPKIANLPAPHALHGFDVQCFKAQDIKTVCQIIGKFPEKITAFVRDSLMRHCQSTFCFLSTIGVLLFARQSTIQSCDFIQVGLEVLRRHIGFARVVNQESFQAEVKPADSTRAGFNLWRFLDDRKTDPKPIEIVALDCDRLYLSANWAGKRKFILVLTDLDLVDANQFPASLFEREALELGYLPKRGTTCFELGLALFVVEKSLVSFVYTLDHFLHRLTADQFPVFAVGMVSAQLSNPLLQVVFRDVSKTRFVRKTLCSNALIPNQTRNVDRLVQFAIMATVVQSVFQRLADFHFPFWSLMYCLTTSSVTAPTVEMKRERVHRLGRRFFIKGYSVRIRLDVHPLICPTILLIPMIGFTSNSRCTWSGITSISKTMYPYSSCFSRISSLSLASIGGTKTLRRYFGQKMTRESVTVTAHITLTSGTLAGSDCHHVE